MHCINSSPLYEMAAISQTTFSKAFSWMEMLEFQFSLLWFCSYKGAIADKSALIRVMACRLFGAKPLPEPMLSQVTDAYAALGRDELIDT